jgi:hypothetical protein
VNLNCKHLNSYDSAEHGPARYTCQRRRRTGCEDSAEEDVHAVKDRSIRVKRAEDVDQTLWISQSRPPV